MAVKCIVCKEPFEPRPEYPKENICSDDCMKELEKKITHN